MLNQVDPGRGPDPVRVSSVHRRPPFGRIFFWSYIFGIPLSAVGAGIVMLVAFSQLDAAVQTYRSAGPCPTASTSGACFTLVPGRLVSFKITRGKTGDTADMTLQLPSGTISTWAMTSWTQEDALHVGVPRAPRSTRQRLARSMWATPASKRRTALSTSKETCARARSLFRSSGWQSGRGRIGPCVGGTHRGQCR